jgi:hypothetical protein
MGGPAAAIPGTLGSREAGRRRNGRRGIPRDKDGWVDRVGGGGGGGRVRPGPVILTDTSFHLFFFVRGTHTPRIAHSACWISYVLGFVRRGGGRFLLYCLPLCGERTFKRE